MNYKTLGKVIFVFAFIFFGIVPGILTGVIDVPAGRGVRAIEYNEHPLEFSFWMIFYIGASTFIFLSIFKEGKKGK